MHTGTKVRSILESMSNGTNRSGCDHGCCFDWIRVHASLAAHTETLQ